MKIALAGMAIVGVATVWDGSYTTDQAKRGQDLYLQQCGGCHGANLEGAEIGSSLTDDTFKSKWDGRSLGDLFEIIRVTMPQDQPGSLTRQQTADVVAFLLSREGFPAGQAEIAAGTGVLNTIRFLAKKP